MTITTKQIRAALDAATPGPWEWHNNSRNSGISMLHHKPSPTGSHMIVMLCDNDGHRAPDKDTSDLIANAPAWLAWCLEQIEARDEIIAGMVNRCGCDREGGCDACAEARKILEESK